MTIDPTSSHSPAMSEDDRNAEELDAKQLEERLSMDILRAFAQLEGRGLLKPSTNKTLNMGWLENESGLPGAFFEKLRRESGSVAERTAQFCFPNPKRFSQEEFLREIVLYLDGHLQGSDLTKVERVCQEHDLTRIEALLLLAVFIKNAALSQTSGLVRVGIFLGWE